jgi:hypothetical protein
MITGADGAMDSNLPNEFHSLKYMSPCSGYWVKINEDAGSAILNLSGSLFNPNCAITLQEGWNLVGCPIDTGYYDTSTHPDMPWVDKWAKVDAPVAKHVFSSIGNKYDMITAEYGAYNPNLPEAFSSLHYIASGFAYWIKMNQAGSLVYPSKTGNESSPLAPPRRQIANSINALPSNSFMLIYGNVFSDNGKAVKAGSQINIYNQAGLLCGQSVVGQSNCYGIMMIYGDDPQTLQIEGAVPGENLKFYVDGSLAVIQTLEFDAGVSWDNIRIPQRIDLLAQAPPKEYMLGQNYPNPFNPETWIPYQLKGDANVTIKIYSATGQAIRTLNLGHKPAGFYNDKNGAAYWDGKNEAGEQVSSGLYFYTIQSGDFTATKKMVIAR